MPSPTGRLASNPSHIQTDLLCPTNPPTNPQPQRGAFTPVDIPAAAPSEAFAVADQGEQRAQHFMPQVPTGMCMCVWPWGL